MSSLVKRFNTFFLIFLNFILLTAVFWLYEKHTVGNDSTVSEWLINYQGGFTRRGIIGEISFQLAKLFNLNLRDVIFLFQSFIYLVYLILVYFYIKNVPKNILTVIALFSPLFLLYPLAEIEVLARKEIFLFIGFLIFLILSDIKYSKKISLCYIFFSFPLLILIWEPFIFFLSFALIIILLKFKKDSFKKSLLQISLSFSSSILTFILILLNPLTEEGHFIMQKSLMDNFNEICYMSCALLASKSSVSAQFIHIYNVVTFEAVFRYILILFIGFFPLSILLFNTSLKNGLSRTTLHIKILSKFKNIFWLFIILLLPSLILFFSMSDWGRIVNIMYTFSILTFIYLIKNNLVIIKMNSNFFENFYINKKKFFLLIFLVFAFGWNPKTAITGDVATNSLYKIIYNTSKKVFNFNGIRLFQNAPLIKFHRKYIE